MPATRLETGPLPPPIMFYRLRSDTTMPKRVKDAALAAMTQAQTTAGYPSPNYQITIDVSVPATPVVMMAQGSAAAAPVTVPQMTATLDGVEVVVDENGHPYLDAEGKTIPPTPPPAPAAQPATPPG